MARDNVGDDERYEDDETYDAGGPSKADFWLQLVEYDRIDYSAFGEGSAYISCKTTQKLLTETAAAGADTDGKGTVLLKVGGHNGDAGHEHHACTETGTEALGKCDLVVFLREAGHHRAEDDEKRPDTKEGVGVTSIEDGTCDDADEKEQGGLNGTNPGDGRWRARTKKVKFVIRLVRPKSIDDAPGIQMLR